MFNTTYCESYHVQRSEFLVPRASLPSIPVARYRCRLVLCGTWIRIVVCSCRRVDVCVFQLFDTASSDEKQLAMGRLDVEVR